MGVRRLSDGPGTIAYLGNSLTAQKQGYRPLLHAALCDRFGQTHRAVNAGFGGVGSIASVCMMDEFVIRHRPDLCFIECMTGDRGVGLHAHGGAAIEAMLAKLQAIGSAACFLNLPRGVARPEDAAIIALYREIAQHHQVAAIDLVDRHWADDELLRRDKVHTTPLGDRRYVDAILEALPEIPPDAEEATSPPLFAPDFSGAAMVPVDASMADASVRRGLFRLHYRYHHVEPGASVRFRLDDKAVVGLLLVQGPHTGRILVNGVEHDLRDRWCGYDRLHAPVFDQEIAPGMPTEIAPLADAPTSALKLIGLLTRTAAR